MSTDQTAPPPPATASEAAPPEQPRRWWGPLLIAAVVVLGGVWITGLVPCGVLSAQPDCWVAMLPGPAEPVDDLIELSGTETYGSGGELLLTTVLVDNRLSVREYVQGLVEGDIDLIPREELYPPGRTVEDAAFENEIMMSDSQLEAKLVALDELGVDYDDLPAGAEVVNVVDDSPASGTDLAAGDVIVEVDGDEVGGVEEAVALLGEHEPGDRTALAVERGDETFDVELELDESPEEPGRPFVGVLLRDYQVLPVDIAIDAGNIGGPSAGLVFTLGIIDRATPGDLTGGRDVAATGTIAEDGTIGPIGGIVQKIVGASESDPSAEVFLVPAGNWDAARSATPDDPITIVRVATVGDAVTALEALAAGDTPPNAIDLG